MRDNLPLGRRQSPWEKRPARMVWLLSLLIGFLAGCAGLPLTQELRRAGTDVLPQRVELRQVPFFPQEEFQCGPASLAMVLNYRGIPVTAEQLRDEVYVPGRKGSFALEMMAAARSRDMVTYEPEPSLLVLLREVAAGNPVLVLQNLGLSWSPYWHYAVLVGFDLPQGEAVLRSGLEERYRMPFELFERTWSRAGHWALLVLPPDRLPVTATESSYLNAVVQLETLGRTEAARRAYQNALSRWPDSRAGLMGLGNTAYALKDYGLAEQAFRHLLRLEPATAVAWNNLAYALAAQACDRDAIAAANCALSLAPGNENILASMLDILKNDASHPGSKVCAPIQCPVALE